MAATSLESSISRDLRDIRRALERSKTVGGPPTRPLSASTSVPNLSGSLRQAQHATVKVKPHDYSREIGMWVAKQLSDLQEAEDEAIKKINEGRNRRRVDDPALWDAHQVATWLQ